MAAISVEKIVTEPLGLIPEQVTKTMVFFGGPFFAYPFKPLWNRYEGSPYPVALAHFRRDHSTDLNLALHCICLIGQLGSNFALLNEADEVAKTFLDKYFGILIRKDGIGPISAFTAGAWINELVRTPAPPLVKVLSTIAIYLAYRRRRWAENRWTTVVRLQAIIDAVAIQLLVRRKPLSDYQGLAAVFAGRVLIGEIIHKSRNSFARPSNKPNYIVRLFVLMQLLVSIQPPKFEAPFLFGLYGWVLALLTGKRWLYLWSLAYVASLGQGIAHTVSNEPPTLPQLEKVCDTLAHTVYFPNILIQSVLFNLKVAMK